jgi:hypothetical protein
MSEQGRPMAKRGSSHRTPVVGTASRDMKSIVKKKIE